MGINTFCCTFILWILPLFARLVRCGRFGRQIVPFIHFENTCFIIHTSCFGACLEIIALDKMVNEFESRDVQLMGCSVDSHYTHIAWRNTPRSSGGIGPIHHPLLSDMTKSISHKYNVLIEDEGIALRGLFLIDKKGILRHVIVNDLPLGRSVGEALRIIDALQHFERVGEVCPADWVKGGKAMKPTAEGVIDYLKTVT